MNLDTDDMISLTEAKNQFSAVVGAVQYEGRQFVLMRQNHAAAALVNVDELDRLQRIDELEENVRLLGLAFARTLTDDGVRHTLDDVAAEFGVDLDD